jgi:hypothetical protein
MPMQNTTKPLSPPPSPPNGLNRQPYSRTQPQNQRTPSPKHYHLSPPTSILGGPTTPNTALNATASSTNTVSNSVPPEGYVCRKCDVPGHWIQQCTSSKTNAPPPTSYICKICCHQGHWIWECPDRLPKAVHQRAVLELQSQIEAVEREPRGVGSQSQQMQMQVQLGRQVQQMQQGRQVQQMQMHASQYY